MNPQFQQHMMANQGMPQGAQQGAPQQPALRTRLLAHFQQVVPSMPWHNQVPPAERVGLVFELITSFGLAKQGVSQENTIKQCMMYEDRLFKGSPNREVYLMQIKKQLSDFMNQRSQQAQSSMNMMGTPQNQMQQGLMGNNMQPNMSNPGNQFGNSHFNPQLQRPMQATPIPAVNNNQNNATMSMAPQNPAANQAPGSMPQQQQQQQPQQPRPSNMNTQPQPNQQQPPLTLQEQQQIYRMAEQLRDRAPPETRAKIMQQVNSLSPEKLAQIRAKFPDPTLAHWQNQARNMFFTQRRSAAQQNQQNGMNGGMPQQGGDQRGGGTSGPNFDYSQIAGQQAEALRSQHAGQLVVPASNNNANMNQLGAIPMGLAQGQQMQQGNQGQGQMNMQQQQQRQGQQQQPMFMNPQQQQQAQAQANQQLQARMQAQAQAQARARLIQQQQAQNHQPASNPQQMNMGRPMGGQIGQLQQSPMPLLTQPIHQAGQQTGATPQQRPGFQQQPGQMSAAMLQAMQQRGQLRQLPPEFQGVSVQVRNQLQTMPEEHYKLALERMRAQQLNGQLQNPSQSGPNPLGQPGLQFMQSGDQQAQQGMGLQNVNAPGMNQAHNQAMQQKLQIQNLQQQQQRQIAQQSVQLGQLPPMTPEIMAEMDQKPFPQLLPKEWGITAPENVKTWFQLKQFVRHNPGAANIGVEQLQKAQHVHYARVRAQAQQAQAMHAQQQLQQQQQQTAAANGQHGGGQIVNPVSMNPVGPAPTAPMVPASLNNAQHAARFTGMNGMMPNMATGSNLSLLQITPQELQEVRNRMNVPPNMTDEQLKQKILHQKRQVMQRQMQTAMEQEQLNQQRGQLSQQQAPIARPTMPMQRPPTANAPQNVQPNGQAQAANRQSQRAPHMTPQSTGGKSLKRPAPSDEVIDISESNQSPPQAPAMQSSRSQQRPSNNQQAQARASNNYLNQAAIDKRLFELNQEVNQAIQRQPAIEVSQAERAQMQAKVAENALPLSRVDLCIKTFFTLTRDEATTRKYLYQRHILVQNVNIKAPNVPLMEHLTMNLAQMERACVFFANMVNNVMKMAKEKQAAQQQMKAGQQDQVPQQPSSNQQPPAQINVDGSPAFGIQSELNAANLEQQQADLRRQQSQQVPHRRNPSKAQQAPPAPTVGPGQMQFPFTVASPQGVPRYGGGPHITSDDLKLQPRKKQKPNNRAGPSAPSTPAQPTPGPGKSPQKIASPDLKRQTGPDVVKKESSKPAMRFKCPEKNCPHSETGFDSPEQLTQHKSHAHTNTQSIFELPSSGDPLDFATKSLAALLGLQEDGTRKPAVPAKSGTVSAALGKSTKLESVSPAGAMSTPMARSSTQTKDSPALDRLKAPSQSGKPAPTSAAQSAIDKAKLGKGAQQSGAEEVSKDLVSNNLEIDDPWKDSTIQPQELYDLFKPFDTLTGDWGCDRVADRAESPATTPDTNISKDTTSTQETDISETDNLNITIGSGKPEREFIPWTTRTWTALDDYLALDISQVPEDMILRIDENTNMNDWDALFGPDKVPGWENENGLSTRFM